MRKSTARPYREHTTEFARGTAGKPPLMRRPRDPLRIPLWIEAPTKFVDSTAKKAPLANFALALLEAGFLNETDLGELDHLVRRGLERVEQSILGRLRHVEEPRLVVSTTIDGLEGYTNNEESDPGHYWIGIELQNEVVGVSVGETLMALETITSGLGQTVLDTIEMAAVRTTGCWSPRFVREAATHTHWYGADTQEAWLEELEAYGSDPEDASFGPGEYDGYFKASWVIDRAQPLDPFALVQVLETEDERVAKIVELVLEAQCLFNEDAAFPPSFLTEREQVFRGTWVRWDDADPTAQVLDDFINYANQSSDCFTTLCSVWEVEATREGFAQWLSGYSQGLKLYKTLDRLLELLSCDVTGEDHGQHQSG